MDEALAEAIGEVAARTAKPLTTAALIPENPGERSARCMEQLIRLLFFCF
jgi:hypothetical protein